MVEGVVNARLQAIITLPVIGPSGHTWNVVSVVDTGFSDFLTLPLVVVEELGLEFAYNLEAMLASGSMETLPVFATTIIWDGRTRDVRAIASHGMSLIGMRMLENQDLHVEVVKGGRVVVQASE